MKTTLKTLLLSLVPLAGFAQEADPLKFGINAGATYSGIRGNDAAKANDYAFDYLVGISLEKPLSSSLSILANLNYERKSFTNTITIENGDPFDPVVVLRNVDTKLTLQYLSLPVNLKYYVGPSKGFYINGGIFAGYYLGETLKADGDKVDDDGQDIFKKLDFGVNLGVGVRFPIDEHNDIAVELRDNLGLISINDLNNAKVKTNAINLIFAWQFDL
jgi:hypothetical protein